MAVYREKVAIEKDESYANVESVAQPKPCIISTFAVVYSSKFTLESIFSLLSLKSFVNQVFSRSRLLSSLLSGIPPAREPWGTQKVGFLACSFPNIRPRQVFPFF